MYNGSCIAVRLESEIDSERRRTGVSPQSVLKRRKGYLQMSQLVSDWLPSPALAGG